MLSRVVGTACALAFLVSSPAVGAEQAAGRKVKVHVFAAKDTSGFVDKKTQERLDSVKDLQGAIVKKKDWMTLSESAEDADIVLEVLGRDYVPGDSVESRTTGYVDNSGQRVNSTTQVSQTYNYVLTTVMRVGEYENPIEAKVSSQYMFASWRSVAGSVADELEEWVKENYGQLMQQVGR